MSDERPRTSALRKAKVRDVKGPSPVAASPRRTGGVQSLDRTGRPRVRAAAGGQGSGMLATYLNDHLAALTGGLELARRSLGAQQGSANDPVAAAVEAVADLLDDDRRGLSDVMSVLGIGVQRHKLVGGWAAEKLGRLKGNGSLLRRSPLSTVVELEGLQLVLTYDAALWRTLAALHSDGERRLAGARPADRARAAVGRGEALEAVRLRESTRVLTSDPALVGVAPR